ncbi:MAG: SprT family zinc-dependent metalloprotease [Anaerolineales bacterium]
MQISIEDFTAEVTLKRIKRMNLRVRPPDGAVSISAPAWMKLEAVRHFALANLEWIRRQQQRLRQLPYQVALSYVDGETHYVWGQPFTLRVTTRNQPPAVSLKAGTLTLSVRPRSSRQKRAALLAAWYREQTRAAAEPLVRRWEPAVGRRISRLYVQQMKTRWGSCNITQRSMRLNSELAKRPAHLLEYVVVHELVHLLEGSHNQVFKAHMTRLLPRWREYRKELSRRGMEPD